MDHKKANNQRKPFRWNRQSGSLPAWLASLALLLWTSAMHQVLCWNGSASRDSQLLQLDPNYAVQWSVSDQEVTFEVHVRTLGFVVFGLSDNGRFEGADLVVAWLQNGRVRFQDRHGISNGESVLDSQQDYDLISAYENSTHTVLRFRRKLFTCDPSDVNITGSTMWMMFSYGPQDPVTDSDVSISDNPHGSRPVYVLNASPAASLPDDVKIWDIRNVEVNLPESEDTLYWCRIFKLPPLERKHHVIKYEPVIKPGNEAFVHHMNIFECDGDPGVFEVLAATEGTRCYQPSMPPLFFNCNNVVVSWTSGSQGFTFPEEAGYPLNRAGGAKFFMLETHYDNQVLQNPVSDNSGLRLYYTAQLRHHDAGVLSVGIDPNWKHIVPPGQRQVISEAHCVSDCTQQGLPSRGINVFAASLHTHALGRQVQLKHIRGDVELPPLVSDSNYNVNFQEYRRFHKPVNVLPGDHLISECTYNSEGRSSITLGGLSSREETCLAYLLYWPRVDLSLCYSLPSLGTILHSLGIQELYPGSEPVRIKSPSHLADQTVEERLISFDWETNFQTFQEVTRYGAFRPLCWAKTQALIDGSSNLDYYPPNVTQKYTESNFCAPRGTLPPRLPKTPSRKNLGPTQSRNRTLARPSSTTTAPLTTAATTEIIHTANPTEDLRDYNQQTFRGELGSSASIHTVPSFLLLACILIRPMIS